MRNNGNVWQPGKVVADIYEVVREIGRGGMGVVYLLRERGTGWPAAAKLPTGKFLADQQLRRRFTREAQVWTQLAAHPNIVRAYDVREVDYRPCIFMEYMDGGSVADGLRASPGGLPFEEAFSVAIQTCWGMAFAHQTGHVHRDLKPANLLRTKEGVVKVTDFGLARPVTLDEEEVKKELAKIGISFDADLAAGMTQGKAVGTWQYMAPEQWDGEATFAVDIYAFGVTLCELFCGQRPLDLLTHPKYREKQRDADFLRALVEPNLHWMLGVFYRQLHKEEEPLDPAMLRQGLPAGIRALILDCLVKRPEERPKDFDAVAAKLCDAYKSRTSESFPLRKPGRVELDQQQKQDRAWALIRLGLGCQFRGDLKEAMSLYQQSEKLFQETNHRSGLSACHINIGNILYSCRDYDGAMEQYQQSLKIDSELGDRAGMSACYHNMGNILKDRGDYDGAMEQYQQSLSIDSELGDRSGMSKCYNNMGLICANRGNYAGAMAWYRLSLEIREELSDRVGIAECYHNMGNVRAELEDYYDALELYQQSFLISEELGDRAGMAECYLNMGNILKNRGDYDGAMEQYQKSLNIMEELGDRAGMANCYHNMGIVYEKRSDPARALEMYRRSLALRRALGLPISDWLLNKIKELGG